MTAPSATITVPEVIERFAAYHMDYPVWGSLHIVLEDFNVDNHHVEWCIEYAIKEGDKEGEELGKILLQMSKSQRLKIAHKA
ncbi:hypothetical protein D3C87_598700 [compost metagenome]